MINRRGFIASIVGSLFLPNVITEKLPEPILPSHKYVSTPLSRPNTFYVNYTHPLAKGLVIASFGR